MDGGQFNLKWNNHKTTFFEILKIQREKANYTDATLAVEGKFYHVHKLVMSTCSEYFSHLFELTPCKSPVIILIDVQSHDIEALLDYIYLGEVNVNQKNLSSLMKTAQCLRIKGLAVTDEDSTRLSKNSTSNHDDPCWDSPSPKRCRYDSKSISSTTFSSVVSQQKSASLLVKSAQISTSILPHSSSNTKQDESSVVMVKMDDTEESETVHVEPSDLKIEIKDEEEVDVSRGENYQKKDKTEHVEPPDLKIEIKDASSDYDPLGEFESDFSTAEPVPESFGNNSIPEPSLQQGIPVNDRSSNIGGGGGGGSVSIMAKPSECSVCGVSFAQKRTLNQHMEMAHPDLFSCSECCAAFTSPGHLETHKQQHLKHACGRCGMSFNNKTALVRHRQQHQGSEAKSFVCEYNNCDARFFQQNELRRHQLSHSGLKPFRCSHCDAGFTRNSSLNKHMRIHTGEKPYVCEECNQAFPYRYQFNRHKATHEQDETRTNYSMPYIQM